MSKITVGVLDNHLNNWHADTFLKLLHGPLAEYEIEIVKAFETHPTGEDWCVKNGVERVETPEAAISNVDAIMILSPDNIEDHLEQCKIALPAGKPTLIDKFLAPTSKEAKEIAALAAQYNTPVFSSSSLRFAVEIESLVAEMAGKPTSEARFTGMGRWEIYGIHTLCMALRIMGPDVKRVIDTGTDTAHCVTLDYGDGARCQLDVRTAEDHYEQFPWTAAVRLGDSYLQRKVTDHDGFYVNLMTNCAKFFQTGISPVSIEESLATVRVLEAATQSFQSGQVWVSL